MWTPLGRRAGADRAAGARACGTGLGNEAAQVQDCLRDGLTESPLVPRAQTLELLARWTRSARQIGVRYDADAARTSRTGG